MASFTHAPKLTPLFQTALTFAADSHNSQIRKQSEIPYIAHLMAVAGLVLEAGGNEQESIAALLHDYLEDIAFSSKIGLDTLGNMFGSLVSCYVAWVTAETHEEYITKITHVDCPEAAKLISAADKLHNLRGYATTGRHLWNEKQAALYAALMGAYSQCDRVPTHWVSEMRFYLLVLKEST